MILTSREKDMTVPLLNSYKLSHFNLGHCGTNFSTLAREFLFRTIKLTRLVHKEQPDIMTAISGTFIAPAGRLARKPVVIFSDTEHAAISNSISYPLSHHLVFPTCYRKPLKWKKVTYYNGYHELAYLHPNYFYPDPAVLKLLDVKENEKFTIMRFVSWESGHDIGHPGLSMSIKRKAVNMFSQYGRVFISSEKELPPDLKEYQLPVPYLKMHDALYYATLLYGESATMASEGSILGTPAIYIDNNGRGYTDEMEKVYGTVFNFSEKYEDQEKSIQKGIEILKNENVKSIWRNKSKKIIDDKIDVTKFIVNFIENYKS